MTINNLILEMTLKGANEEEMMRAINYSMAALEQHKSYIRNGIKELELKYGPLKKGEEED